MIDVKKLIENPEEYKKVLKMRGSQIGPVDKIIELDGQRRELIAKVESLRAQKNTKSKEFGQFKKEGKDTSSLDKEIKNINDELGFSDEKLKLYQDDLDRIVLSIPNYLLPDVPDGLDSSQNKLIREWEKNQS